MFYFRELGDEEIKKEFNGYFDSLTEDVSENMKKYSESVAQLETLLELEKETLIIKRKVATFSLDYDDDLVINFIRSVSIAFICQLISFQSRENQILLQLRLFLRFGN